MYGLLLRSGNDAAVQIALTIGGSVEEFAKLMNEKAKNLNLQNTHFVTPHGLDNPEHYTTAYELAILTDYALKNKKFADIVNTKTYTIKINEKSKIINNTNELLGNLNGVNGVKTGFTNNAGRCLVTSTTRNNFQIISVVLGADTKKNRTKDSINLIEYCYKNYELVNIKKMIEDEYKKWKEKNINIKIDKGESQNINNYLVEVPFEIYPIKKDEIKNIICTLDSVNYLKAPIYENDTIGNIELKVGEKNICNVDIKCSNRIDKKDIFDYFFMLLFNMGTYIESRVDLIFTY